MQRRILIGAFVLCMIILNPRLIKLLIYHLMVLDHRRTERWKRILGEWYIAIFIDVMDFNRDGIHEIVTARQYKRAIGIIFGEIWIINGRFGKIEVFSKKGTGTKIAIYLPPGEV